MLHAKSNNQISYHINGFLADEMMQFSLEENPVNLHQSILTVCFTPANIGNDDKKRRDLLNIFQSTRTTFQKLFSQFVRHPFLVRLKCQ